MPIFKIQHRGNYVSIPNETLRDKRLSIETRGVLCYLLTNSDTFDISLEFLQSELDLGRDKLKNIIRELKINGYLSLVPAQNALGVFSGQEWFIFAESQERNFLESPYHRPTEKPSVGLTVGRLNRPTENTSDILKEKLREKKSNKEENKREHTHKPRARENFSNRRADIPVPESEAQQATRSILEGLRVRKGLQRLPDEDLYLELSQWAFVNKITAERVLLCYDTLETQRKHPVHWRRGRTTAKTVMENLPTLEDLIAETNSIENEEKMQAVKNIKTFKTAAENRQNPRPPNSSEIAVTVPISNEKRLAMGDVIDRWRLNKGWNPYDSDSQDLAVASWVRTMDSSRIPASAYQELYERALKLRASLLALGKQPPEMGVELMLACWEKFSGELEQRRIDAHRFLPETAASDCPRCYGLGMETVYEAGGRVLGARKNCDHRPLSSGEWLFEKRKRSEELKQELAESDNSEGAK